MAAVRAPWSEDRSHPGDRAGRKDRHSSEAELGERLQTGGRREMPRVPAGLTQQAAVSPRDGPRWSKLGASSKGKDRIEAVYLSKIPKM